MNKFFLFIMNKIAFANYPPGIYGGRLPFIFKIDKLLVQRMTLTVGLIEPATVIFGIETDNDVSIKLQDILKVDFNNKIYLGYKMRKICVTDALHSKFGISPIEERYRKARIVAYKKNLLKHNIAESAKIYYYSIAKFMYVDAIQNDSERQKTTEDWINNTEQRQLRIRRYVRSHNIKYNRIGIFVLPEQFY